MPTYAPDAETLSRISLETFADDVEAVRVALGYDQIAVLGHSIHGQIALAYGEKYPASTSRIILVPLKLTITFGACSLTLFLLVAPLQFSERLRRRSPSVHRWNGRVLVGIALILAVTGLFFGAFVPLAGAPERVVVSVFATVLIVALVAAVVSIRRGDVRSHRAWMIRAFAVMIGIATIRVLAPGLDIVMTPLGFAPETVFVTALWTGWGGTLGAAEYWLRSSLSGVQRVR